MLHHTHESYSGSTFNTLGVEGTGVTTVMLESINLLQDEWISLIEVINTFWLLSSDTCRCPGPAEAGKAQKKEGLAVKVSGITSKRSRKALDWEQSPCRPRVEREPTRTPTKRTRLRLRRGIPCMIPRVLVGNYSSPSSWASGPVAGYSHCKEDPFRLSEMVR